MPEIARTYSNACFRIRVLAGLPCFHDLIGWYLDFPEAHGDETPVLDVTFRIHDRPNSWSGRAPTLANAHVDVERGEIDSWPRAQAGERVPMSDGPLFFNQPLAYLLQRRGYHLLHAAFVRREGRRLLVMGDSGVGKSSIAVLLSLHGWQLLSDDVTFAREGPGGPDLLPLATRVKYRSPALEGLVAERPTPVNPVGLRTTDPIDILFPRFVRGTEARLESLSKHDGTRRLIAGNTIRGFAGPEEDRAARRNGFEILCGLARSARSFKLSYDDRCLADIPHLVDGMLAGEARRA